MPWQVLTGVVEWWADEGLRDVGRRRFHEARGNDVGSGDAPPGVRIDVAGSAFAARRVPWRLTELSLGSPDDEVAPAVTSWADEATAVLKGSPAEQHMVGSNERWGDLGLRRMLEPAPLETLVPRPWPAEFRVAGHLLERDFFVLPEFASLATDHYEVMYDADLDVLTMWAAVIDGEVAQRTCLTHLTSVEPAPSPSQSPYVTAPPPASGRQPDWGARTSITPSCSRTS